MGEEESVMRAANCWYPVALTNWKPGRRVIASLFFLTSSLYYTESQILLINDRADFEFRVFQIYIQLSGSELLN